jgi:superfamily II DNA or RNA helicase
MAGEMPHDIIDNRESYLADAVRPLLNQSVRAHFAVGYFFLSGFKAIARELEKVQEVRLLIGNTSDRATVEQLAEGHASREAIVAKQREGEFLNAQQRAKLVEEGERKIRERLERLDQTDEDQALVEQLVRLISEDRLKVKVYTRSRLHAKAYLFDYPTDRFEHGLGIVGSSNLSLGGLRDNTELNVVVHGNANHEQLLQWFSRLWDEAEPFAAELMTQLKASWALDDSVTPYELYLKVLYHLTKDRLEEPDVPMPADFPPLADFQWAAVKSSIRLLKLRHGVFISDVVGLGKSFIAAALLKWLKVRERQRALIICPTPLVKMWRERFVDRYDLGAEVLSLGMLSQPNFAFEEERFQNKQIVLLDESHNLRHSDSLRYDRLHQFLHALDLPAILLTATPRNSRARDILNQIRLFNADDRIDLGVEPRSLSKYFKLVEADERPLPPLLQHFLIRRTRKHIREHWPDANVDGRPVRFPNRVLRTIDYSIEKTYGGFYRRLRDLIEPPDPHKKKLAGMTYARYGLHLYVVPGKKDVAPYNDLVRAGQRLHGLMRTLLFKRLESSVEAFRQTVTRMIERHKIFLRGLDEGFVVAGEQVEDMLKGIEEGDAERDDLMAELEKLSGKYALADFRCDREVNLRGDVEADLATLQEMARHVEPITPREDAKLQRLLQWLDAEPLLRSHKLLIFTQYIDTAHYLAGQLQSAKIRPPETIEHADSSRDDLQTLVSRFAPIANEARTPVKHPIHILVATDVLSEGLNLQDAALILNYDLHFNPVRLIQRFGRIDRINSPHQEIYAYNFLPELELERNLGIRAILHERIKDIHETIGEDSAILEPDEQLNPDAMYAIYEGDGKRLEAIEDELEASVDLEVQEAEDLLRRIKRQQPELFNRISSLPSAIRSGKTVGQASRLPVQGASPPRVPSTPPAVFFFGQAGDFQRLWLADAEANILAEDNHSSIATIACPPEERRQKLPPNYNTLVTKLKARFDQQYQEYLAAGGTPHRLTVAQRWALDTIRDAYRKATDLLTAPADIKTAQERLERLRKLWSVSPLDGPVEFALRGLRGQKPPPAEALNRLESIAFEHKLDALAERHVEMSKLATEPLIICTEALL